MIFLLTALFVTGSVASAIQKHPETLFKYAAGTEGLPDACEGNLELTADALAFKCRAGLITVPYNSIRAMQYRPDVSPEVRKMKLKWKVRPPLVPPFWEFMWGGKRNRYFTVLYSEADTTHAVVLEVQPEIMRPYLAEIDLRVGKRVEVKRLEEY